MIRRGKAEGWLAMPPASLRTFAAQCGVDFGPSVVTAIPGKGAALAAARDIAYNEAAEQPLLRVPRDMVISKENVLLEAKANAHLRQVLDAMPDWSMSPRLAILIFLLVQITHSCPDVSERVGLSSPFAEYVKSLPLEELPTFWTEEELALLDGTSLKPATEAKMTSLYREYDELRAATLSVPWCAREWWDEVDGLLQFDDWRQVDAMYRSRALEFPGIGDCMIPCIDIANHAAGDRTVARYEADRDGNALLLLAHGRDLKADEEITITYGDEKGACEMIFSYGFLDPEMASAQSVFLGIDVADDDPLKRAKEHVNKSAPGVKLSEDNDIVTWTSEYVWLAIANEEDGLSFDVLQTVDGDRHLQLSFGNDVMSDISQLKTRLQEHQLWPVFRLRATVVIQDRIEEQLRRLYASQDSPIAAVREIPKQLGERLRLLETNLLERAYETLEAEKNHLTDNAVVLDFLAKGVNDEDFS